MRHYILKQYDISHDTYMSVYYLIRSYKEIKQRMEDVLYASPEPPDGQPKGSALSDPTYSKAAVRCTLDSQLKAIEQTAHEMAEGAAKAANADAALSATGIAGPGGGTEEKPVGLVYIGCYLNGKTTVKECRWNGSRMENRLDTVKAALEMLKERLVEEMPV